MGISLLCKSKKLAILNSKKIVITGGPGTGKTSVINGLEKAGYKCFHEVIRDITMEAKKAGDLKSFTTNPIALVSDSELFNQKLLEGRTQHYKASFGVKDEVVFFDRGIPDVLAYMNYFKQEYDGSYVNAAVENKYDVIFLLPMWKSIYTNDDERFESYEEGVEIENQLKEIYTRCGYDVIMVPKDTIDNRINFILETIG